MGLAARHLNVDIGGRGFVLLNGLTLVGAPSGDTSGATDLRHIQGALNSTSAGGVTRLRPGGLYTLNTPNTKTVGTAAGSTTSQAFGLDIPSGVTLDLNGAQIKAASGALGILIINRNPTNGGGDVNVGLISSTGLGIIDGNNQVPVSVGARGLVHILWSTAPTVSNILIRNGYTVAFMAYGNTRGNYDLITVDTIKGGGIDLGQPFPNASENQATVGRLFTANCSTEPGNTFFNPGNGVYLVMQSSTVDTLYSLNNTGGDKLDRPSQDVVIKSVYGINNGDSGGNSGFKFQGGTSSSATTSSSPVRCSIGLLHMVNQNGTGLYMQGCVDCTVTKYVGENNGLAAGFPDVWLGGVRDRVDNLFSDNAFIDGVSVRTDAVDPSIGKLTVRNPNQSNTASIAALRQQGGSLTVDKILAVDELPSPVNVAATAQVGGGTFAGGVLQTYMVTYTNAQGETTGSSEVSATPVASGSVLLTWGTGALPTGVTGVKVYRATTSFGEYTTPALVATLGTVQTYTDTGSAVGAGAVPLVNTASTLKMKAGVAQNTTSCVLRCDSITVRGAATNSFNAAGIITQTPAIGAQALPSGYYVVPKTGNVTGILLAQGFCAAIPILIGENGTLTQIGVNVTVIGQAGALCRLGVYADSGHGLPGALLVDAGTVAGDTLNYKETAISVPVVPGRYFLAYAAQNCATTAPTVSGTSSNVDPPIQSTVGSNAATVANYSCYQQSGITGALPSTWGAAGPAASTPRPIVKVA